MPGGTAYSIEPAELDAVVTDLERCESALDATLDDLERDMTALHGVWEGLSAQAHQEAQAEWRRGMRAMRTALAELRAAARGAHGNYTQVVSDNAALWRGLA